MGHKMDRYEINSSAESPHFIGSWIIDPLSICEDIIDFFESNPRRHVIGSTLGDDSVEHKRTTDISVSPKDLVDPSFLPVRELINKLMLCYQDYAEQWPFIKENLGNLEMGPFNIQRYQPGDHFQTVHAERTDFSASSRALVWMTYLNDVEEGGATSFVHYGLDVQPKRGQTLIWPVDWTHAHCGNVITVGHKYILTGWFLFPVPKKESNLTSG